MQFAQIDELYSLKTFWVSFLVVSILTILFLASFGVLSDRYQGKIIYTGLTKTWFQRRKHRDKVPMKEC